MEVYNMSIQTIERTPLTHLIYNEDYCRKVIPFLKEDYFEGETEPVLSRLGGEPALRTHLLSLIASGTINTKEGLHGFLEKTLFGSQGELWRTQHRLNKVLNFLDEESLIEIEGKPIIQHVVELFPGE